ncbi:hypothetical protein Tco_0911934 [Tanacetum coccineum]
MDCHVGNSCAHTCDLTVDREYPMIGFDLRAKKKDNVESIFGTAAGDRTRVTRVTGGNTYHYTEETRSGSTTTHANNSLPEYDSFLFEIEPDQGGLTGIVISDNSNDPLLELPEFESFHFDLDPSFPRPPPEPPDVENSLIIKTDAPVMNNFDNKDESFDPGGSEINVKVDNSFTFVTWIFLPYLTYPAVSPLLSSTKNEDTIFNPGIST